MSAALAEALAWALVHSLWQAAGVAVLLLALLWAVGPAHARVRHGAAGVALLLQLALPVLTLALELRREAAPALPSLASGAGQEGGASLSLGLCAVWAAGVVVMGLRLALGLRGVHLLLRGALPVPPTWQPRLEALRARLGVRRPVRWLVSRATDVPLTVGWLRPVVLLPLTALTGLPPAQLELLVAHELLHVRRWDYAVNLLQSLVEVVLFFHPAVWWVSARLREEREACCDDGVVRMGVEPLAYARALVALEAQRLQPGELTLASNGGALMERVQRLVGEGSRRRGGGGARAAVGAALAVAVLLGAGAVAAVPPVRLTSAWLPPPVERHRADIEAVAARHGVDPDLVALVVLAESMGNAQARSPSGARGLMQLMPGTARKVAQEGGVALTPDALDTPAVNLDLGTRYLAQQLARFAAHPEPVALAVAAYNAGPERVQAFLEGREPLPAETQRYQALVTGMWRERAASRSGTYEGWRARLRERLASLAGWPVEGGRVTLRHGERTGVLQGQAHRGVDLAAPAGTPVVAPLDGVVVDVSRDAERGVVVVLQHAGGVQTRYHHLGPVRVEPRQRVARGEPFAEVGTTGRVTGPHVHYEVVDLGESLDPAPFLR